MNTYDLVPSIPSYRQVRRALPSSRQIRRAMRRSPYLPGRPYAAEDSHFWAGILFGLGVGALAVAFFASRIDPELRQRVRERASQMRHGGMGHSRSGDGHGSRTGSDPLERPIGVDAPITR